MLPHRARIGLLAAACLLGALLVGTTAWTAVGVHQRTHELAAAEAHVFGRALHDIARDGPPDEAALEAFVATHSADGLRWAALIGSDGAVLASAGTPGGPVDDLPRTPRGVVDLGETVRVRLPPPPPRGPPPRGPGGPASDRGPGGPASDRGPGGPASDRGPGGPASDRGPGGPAGPRPPPQDIDGQAGDGWAAEADRPATGAWGPQGDPRPPPQDIDGQAGDGWAAEADRPATGAWAPQMETGAGDPQMKTGAWGPQGDPRPPPPDGPPPELVIEFVPVVALDLATRSRRAVWIALTGAVVLVAASIVFVRSWARAEAAEQDLARTRHLASLGQMSAVLAHEIRNPLAALKGHAQLLAELLTDGAHRARADRVVHEAVRLETLTTSLLDFARTARIERSPADPVELLREAAAPFAGVRVTGAAPTWSLDAGRIRQVLENLLRNATQADPGGAVDATVAVEGGELVYTIRDRGPGIPDDARERVFESFETGRTDGVGLGLPIAKRIVHLHGGTVVAGTHPDGGAVLTVRIPES